MPLLIILILHLHTMPSYLPRYSEKMNCLLFLLGTLQGDTAPELAMLTII